jgi:VanZ family protein
MWCATVAWAAVIFMMSAKPGSQIPGRFAEIGHFTEYLVLGMLLFGALKTSGWRRAALLALVVASLYGVSDEFHQAFVPQRTPDPMDWALDTLGAAVGVLLARFSAAHAGAGLHESADPPAQ